jgi:superoxide dismutase
MATERTQYIEPFFRNIDNIDWAMVERRLQETGVGHPAG